MNAASVEDRLLLLERLTLFARLPRAELLAAASHVLAVDVPEGATLFRLGDPGDRMYVLLSGRVRLSLPSETGVDEVVNELGPGEWFGEMALLSGEARSATARAIAASRLLALPRAAFRDLAQRLPELGLRLCETLSRRLRSYTLRDLPKPPPRLLLLPDAGSPPTSSATIDQVAIALARETRAPVALVDLLDPTARVIESGVERLPVPADWPALLDPAERRRIVVRLPPDHPWLATLVAAGTARVLDDALGRLARAPLGAPALVSGDATQIVRRFLGRRTALVLGAGGARGLAHIGALRVFEREDLRIDLVVGTSMGAILGGFLALGWSARTLEERFRDIAAHFRRKVLDLGIPGESIFRGAKKQALLESETEGRDIESLLVPFAAIAADLTHAREHVLDRGPLWRAMDASSAIPTIFPPVVIDDLRLVDGWVTNPLPVAAARRLGADKVIALDPCTELEVPNDCAPRRRRRLSLFDAGALFRTAMRAMDVGARERAAASRAEADVCILPRLDQVTGTDVHRFEEILDAGEVAAEAALPEIRAALSSGRESLA